MDDLNSECEFITCECNMKGASKDMDWISPPKFTQRWSVYESIEEATYRHHVAALNSGVVSRSGDIHGALLAFTNFVYEEAKSRLGEVHLACVVDAGYISSAS